MEYSFKRLEKKRLQLYKRMLELENKMDECSLTDYLTIQFEYGVVCRKLLKIEKQLKNLFPSDEDEFDYDMQIKCGGELVKKI